MKKISKFVSVILALIMALGCFAVCAYAEAPVTSTTPVVMMMGQGAEIYTAEGKRIYNFYLPDTYIADAVSACLPAFKDAILNGKYDEWRDMLFPYIDNVFEPLRLNGDGEIPEGQHIIENQLSDAQLYQRAAAANGSYNCDTFRFSMDWRQDPFEVADQLRHRIEVVKAATGFDKVSLICRCQANAVLCAYLLKYGSDDLDCVSMYAATLGGVEAVSGAFSGNFDLDSKALVKFYESMDLTIEDDLINDLINNTIGVLQDTYGLDIACALIRPVLSKLYSEAVYECVLRSFGTFPGIWTLVSSADYKKAKEGVFAGKEEEYAGLIAKLDRYHNEIGLHYKEIIQKAADNGVKFSVVAKYNDAPMYPVCKDNLAVADMTVTLENSSFGATSVQTGKKLSAAYVAAANAKGKAGYISPDGIVDASTCMFPDTTWIIYNVDHKYFEHSITNIGMRFIASGGTMTVSDDPVYTQFLTYIPESDTLVPMTAENGMQVPEDNSPKTPEGKKKAFLQKLFDFLKTVFSFIFRLMNNK